jgi:ABC-type Fe3+/spermidine/putrescine transport system ATPase subunit
LEARKHLINIRGIRKAFGPRNVLRDISFKVGDDEVVGLVGPSGVGKSTTLNIIAGLLEPDSGEVTVNGIVVTRKGDGVRHVSVPPALRGLGYVMQDNTLFPNMTVSENIRFGPSSRNMPRGEVEKILAELSSLIHVDDLKDLYPHQLSGGQQKRVALARTLAVKPKILLMDEPLTSLDSELKKQLMDDLKALLDRLDATIIYVTHDQEEAESMADRIERLQDGFIRAQN